MPNQGDVLRAIRDDRGFSISDVSDAIGVKPTRLAAFESGEKKPTRRQVGELAKVYGVYPYQLHKGTKPNLPPLPKDFRKANSPRAKLTVNGYKAYLFGERIAAFTRSIEQEPKGQLQFRKYDFGPEKNPNRLAEKFKAEIGFEDSVYLELNSPARAQRYLRACVEAAGVNVMTSWYDHEDFRGFYYKYFDEQPMIMIHSKGWDLKSRVFTFAHEIGHWLLGQEGISDPFITQNSTERYCNKFAASLLASEASVQAAISRTATRQSDVSGFVRNVASKLLLSQYATAIRLVELQIFSDADFSRWIALRNSAGDPKGGFGSLSGEPPGAGQRILPRYGFLTAFSIRAALRGRIADSLEIFQATGITESNQKELVKEAEAQTEEMGIK